MGERTSVHDIKRDTHGTVALSSTSTNVVAFSMTCPTETKDKISSCDTAAAFNKKTARNNNETFKVTRETSTK